MGIALELYSSELYILFVIYGKKKKEEKDR